MTELAYDVIGDVHGCAQELKALLKLLGYGERRGVWWHPRRHAVFVGDLIDRGPEIVEVLEMVAAMVEVGNAVCLLGNHERDFIFFNLLHESGEPIRPRSQTRQRQLQATHLQLGTQASLRFWLDWCRRLPLYFEAPGLRVAHAAWDDSAAAFWRERRLSDNAVCEQLVSRQSEASISLEWLLFGPCLFVERNGTICDVRVRWYDRSEDLPEANVWHAAIRRADWVPRRALTGDEAKLLRGYASKEPPLIFGHNSLPLGAALQSLRTNLACVDYSAVYGGRLCAYRWSGESRLRSDHFAAVPARAGLRHLM